MKKCSSCKCYKDYENFHKNKSSADGYNNMCKPCRNAWGNKRYWEKGREYARKYLIDKSKDPDWVAKNRLSVRKSLKRYRLINSLKTNARSAVYNALKSSKLIKPSSCEFCKNTTETQAHHWHGYDVDKWLDIIWLCKECHKKFDVSQRRQLRTNISK
jgi:hypothetical protein